MGDTAESLQHTAGSAGRLVSLDVFRGGDIVLMLLVNSIRGNPLFPDQLTHAAVRSPLHGITLADLVFPWFLMIIGVALPFSYAAGRGRGAGTAGWLLLAARRAAILYILGCILHAAKTAPTEPLTWRIVLTANILTEIAAAYFVAVLIHQFPRPVLLGIIAMFLIGKWYLFAHVPYPGEDGPMWTETQNMHEYLRERFGQVSSLLKVCSSASIVIIGTLAGEYLRAGPLTARRAGVLGGAGGVLVAISWLWHFDMPYSTMYSTPTATLLGAGTGLVVLGATIYAVDVRHWTRAEALQVFGRNPIAIYFGVELLWAMVLTTWLVKGPDGHPYPVADVGAEYLKPVIGATGAAWAMVLLHLGLCWLGARELHRRRIYLKV